MQGLHRDDLQNNQYSFFGLKTEILPGIKVVQGPSSIRSSLKVPLAFCNDCSSQRLTRLVTESGVTRFISRTCFFFVYYTV